MSLSEVLLLLHCVALTAEVWSEVGRDRCCVASILNVLVEANDLGYTRKRTVEANAEADGLSTTDLLSSDVL